MKHWLLESFGVTVLFAVLPLTAARGETKVSPPLPPVIGQRVWAPVYKSPNPDAPKVRVDGTARGVEDALLTLTVLAPEHVGLTTKEQPSLFWFQSKSARTRFELTIVESKKPEPLVEIKLPEPTADGIQRFRLADHDVRLAEGVEYRWTVAMVIDPENRSKDVIASGVIKRVAQAAKLSGRLKSEPPTEAAFIYADEGIWYDSLEALSDLIDQKPKDPALHQERAIFFMQVGLKDAAIHEAKLASNK